MLLIPAKTLLSWTGPDLSTATSCPLFEQQGLLVWLQGIAIYHNSNVTKIIAERSKGFLCLCWFHFQIRELKENRTKYRPYCLPRDQIRVLIYAPYGLIRVVDCALRNMPRKGIRRQAISNPGYWRKQLASAGLGLRPRWKVTRVHAINRWPETFFVRVCCLSECYKHWLLCMCGKKVSFIWVSLRGNNAWLTSVYLFFCP